MVGADSGRRASLASLRVFSAAITASMRLRVVFCSAADGSVPSPRIVCSFGQLAKSRLRKVISNLSGTSGARQAPATNPSRPMTRTPTAPVQTSIVSSACIGLVRGAWRFIAQPVTFLTAPSRALSAMISMSSEADLTSDGSMSCFEPKKPVVE